MELDSEGGLSSSATSTTETGVNWGSVEDLNDSLLFLMIENDNHNYNNVNNNNGTIKRELPPHLRFYSNTLVVVVVYALLFVMAAVGNLTALCSLLSSRHRQS